MWLLLFTGICVAFIALWIALYLAFHPLHYTMEHKHILITGGSSGIGLSVAVDAVKRKAACVTIIARNQKLLDEAAREIAKHCNDKQIVQAISLDVSTSDLQAIRKTVDEAEAKGGAVDVLVNCAGTSLSKSFRETSPDEFRKLMEINYLGTVHMCKCVIDGMVERNSGRIVITSSVAGHLGLFGYSAYSASKFALRGLAECLQMEMQPHNIRVSLVFPPDTDTPGYKLEQLEKSEETQLISEYGGLFEADKVAQAMLDGVEGGVFLVPVGFDGWVMSSTACGLTCAPPLQTIAQVLLSGVFRLVSLFYLYKFNGIVKSCHARRALRAAACAGNRKHD